MARLEGRQVPPLRQNQKGTFRMTPTQEQIEAAAQAFADCMDQDVDEWFRNAAKAALTAAAGVGVTPIQECPLCHRLVSLQPPPGLEALAKAIYQAEHDDIAWERLAEKYKRAYRLEAACRLEKGKNAMLRWALKSIDTLDTDGRMYRRDVEELEMLVDGKWITVPHIDIRPSSFSDSNVARQLGRADTRQ
jgi:hypothetical protein